MKPAAASAGDAMWNGLMAAGFGLLGLSPAAFWSMTPREIEAALGAHLPAFGAAPGRGDLAALMNAFPDGRAKEQLHG